MEWTGEFKDTASKVPRMATEVKETSDARPQHRGGGTGLLERWSVPIQQDSASKRGRGGGSY